MRHLLLASILLLNLSFKANSQGYNSGSRADVDNALAPFYHGVASGDPLTDRVILWTRITTNNASETLNWQIATDTGFTTVINSGSATTDASKDFTVKVDATGLQPGTWYYFRFNHNGVNSITGRTRTMPTGSVSNVRFAVVACSNYQSGYFNAYKDIVTKNDVDAVIHLGDYFYEYGPDDFDPGVDSSRIQEPFKEITELEDYRMRHSFYKLDPDLRAVHQQYPMIAVWDDHESANDSWSGGAENHTPGTEGNWADRVSYSKKSYFEWMPIRDVHNSVDTIHRTIPIGDLADLIMVDTRIQGREQQAGTSGSVVNDTNRTMLGNAQFQWLKQQLSNSSTRWHVIGNQVMFAPLKVFGQALNQDQWDGYPAERTKIIRHLSDNGINNMVVLTGDIHTSWANDIPHPDSTYTASTGKGSAAVEYVCTSVTSGSFITFPVPGNIIPSLVTHVKYAELSKRGYLLLDVTPQKVHGDWIYMSTITSKNFTSSTAASWCCNDGSNRLTSCSALSPRGTNPAIAPIVTSANAIKNNVIVMGCYPNPVIDEVKVQYYLFEPGTINVSVSDVSGKVVHRFVQKVNASGLYNSTVELQNVPNGTYVISINAGGKTVSQQIVKQ